MIWVIMSIWYGIRWVYGTVYDGHMVRFMMSIWYGIYDGHMVRFMMIIWYGI